MGECDLDGSSRLVTTTPGLLRFFFGDILFSGMGMGGRDGWGAMGYSRRVEGEGACTFDDSG